MTSLTDHNSQPELTPALVLDAYARGIFPMAEARDADGLFWLDPDRRGIIPLDGLHISRSLRKLIAKTPYRISLNEDFSGTVKGCADRDETWINGPIYAIYRDLHQSGHAHSLELWDGAELVGGIYGVTLNSAFFGESMFSRRSSASKIALAYLVKMLNINGFTLFDTQFITPHLASMGGIEISRAQYRTRLKAVLKVAANLDPTPLAQLSTDELGTA